MEWEANPGSVAGMGGNIARYNWVYGCNHHGIRSHGSSDIQVYGNVVGPNQQAAQVGLNDAELFMYINQQHITGQGSDLKNNDFHDNLVTTPSSGSNKRAAALQVQTGTGQPDPTPYTDGTKNLHFNADRYHLGTLLGSGSVFYWNTNKSWGGWQAIPQDAAGSAVA
jgi:hypothetical protein